ncbi:bifunctional glycosyltransferase/CDP-glycerol:glycerophosphate glycerophosphotransferase [Streptomyces sp. ML-6]|uniref:bifunctional glycosyltransferase/CDP-glycerol:glycerophosphate glycerophosphotransferase n=1 Tax=Streptomyces sp. ML-6 TaxID=2982693 RepID=UPI0024C0CC93|nr:bifunctional glycosyltransferase/CDP-glycerol:glycerophosphate glycerophosphotransferase [Streptomyces sp. ML-6]MDK0519795.1 CDP-glycerol glycerophosphotransferase family protein [Streptomyces sp. ML-6]
MLTMSPRLSVVVPVHNVELHLTDCLKSLAEQTMSDLEVVMVDDGSTDGSADLAAEFAGRDGRFRLVGQENGGPGHARNTGVRDCDPGARHLAFVDSDDVLPPRAYELLLGALDETGSDLASGNVLRLGDDGRLQQSPDLRRPMATTRLRTHISRDWDLAADRSACNKVFRRSFWDEHAFAFPVGTLHEDIPVVLPAHFLARSVDVLEDPVYHRRERPGRGTTRRAVVRGVQDRVSHVLAVSAFLDEHRGAADKRRYEAHVLADDLRHFMAALPHGDEEYRRAFLTYANEFADQVDPAVLDGLPLRLRLMWYLVRERRTAELLDLLALDRAEPGAFAVRGLRRRTASYPVLTRPVPRAVLRVGERDLPLTARLRSARWQGGRLHLKGYAYIRNLPAGPRGGEFRAGWLRAGRRRVVPLRLRTVDEPEATARSRQSLHDYDRSGFETVVDPAGLRIDAADGPERLTWRLEIGVAGHGMLRRSALAADEETAPPPVHRPDGDHRIVPDLDDGELVLHAERIDARFETHRAGDAGDGAATVVIDGMIRDRLGRGPLRLALTHRPSGTSFDCPVTVHEGAASSVAGWRRFTADIPLDAFAEVRPGMGAGEDEGTDEGTDEGEPHAQLSYDLRLVGPDGRRTPIDVPGPVPPGRYPLDVEGNGDGGGEGNGDGGAEGDGSGGRGGRRELGLTVNSRGNLLISDRTVQPAVDLVTWTQDGRLLLEGTYPALAGRPVELIARHGGHDEEAVFPLILSGDAGARRFRAELRPDAVDGPGRKLPLGQGRWHLLLREHHPAGDARPGRDTPLRIPAAAHRTLPAVRTLTGREYRVERRCHDQLLIDSAPVLTARERGPRGRRLLSGAYRTLRTAPLRETVLYSSFDGRQYSDSPRAIHEEIVRRGVQAEHLWVVRDQQARVPAGAATVEHGSTAWHEALARSRYVVTNTQLPEWFERREGQYVVQTWHGTPLKRIGLDLAGTDRADPAHLATLERRARQWSLLVSPNSFSTPVLRRSFGYRGEILECGSPRNDLLRAVDRTKVAAAVRERLGLPADRRVVLYAPTWRDDRPLGDGRYALDLWLDLAAAERELGADTVLLVRRHHLVGGRLPDSGSGFVRDVSRHDDAGELMLISDALVTDCSSLMFDFAPTGRPLLFHTHDLAHHRDTRGGFCFDFEARAPGPLIADSAGLIEALRDPARATEGHGRAYEAFRRDFCDLDEGNAAAKVVDRML